MCTHVVWDDSYNSISLIYFCLRDMVKLFICNTYFFISLSCSIHSTAIETFFHLHVLLVGGNWYSSEIEGFVVVWVVGGWFRWIFEVNREDSLRKFIDFLKFSFYLNNFNFPAKITPHPIKRYRLQICKQKSWTNLFSKHTSNIKNKKKT